MVMQQGNFVQYTKFIVVYHPFPTMWVLHNVYCKQCFFRAMLTIRTDLTELTLICDTCQYRLQNLVLPLLMQLLGSLFLIGPFPLLHCSLLLVSR